MQILITILVTFFAGMGAGLGTGFAGMSAAAVISPMLITFLGMDPYMAVGIALSSDVLASAISAYTYAKNKILISKRSDHDGKCAGIHRRRQLRIQPGAFRYHGEFLRVHDFPVRYQIHRPSRNDHQGSHARRLREEKSHSVSGMRYADRLHLWFRRRRGGMMMLLILTSVLGYELKTAVGTSVFIMAFTAFTGAASHFAIGGMPDWTVWILCVVFTLIWARIAALFANKATPKTLNRVTGVILVVLGIAVMCFNLLA